MNERTKRMGTEPIAKLLTKMSLPAMLSMLVQSLYNVVDGIFISHYSEKGFLALSIVFPLQFLITSFAIGVGIGTNSIVSRKLGEGKKEEANKYAQTGLFLSLVLYGVFLITSIFLPKLFVQKFSTDPQIIEMGTIYLTIVTIFSFGIFIEILCNKALQASGNMTVPMFSQLIGAITNIILDPILIFGKLGMPEMGIKGAAIATVIGQLFAMIYTIIMASRNKDFIRIFFEKNFKLKRERVKTIIQVAAPTTIMNAVGSVTLTALNAILTAFSPLAVSVLGIYFKVQSFIFMPCFGLTQGALPIMGYNYGSNDIKRFKHTYWLSVIVGFIIMIIGLLMFQFGAVYILKIFKASEEVVKIGVPALRILSLSFPFAAFGIMTSSMFQSVGYGFNSMLMSLLRQLIITLPCAYFLAKFVGIGAVWYSYLISEAIVVMIFLPIGLRCIKKVFKKKTLSLTNLDNIDIKEYVNKQIS